MHFQQVLYSASHSVSHYFGVVVNLRKLQRQCLHLPKIHVVKRGWSLWSLNKKAVGLNMLCNVQTKGYPMAEKEKKTHSDLQLLEHCMEKDC